MTEESNGWFVAPDARRFARTATLIDWREKPDQVRDVVVERDPEVLAADVDRVAIDLGGEGGLLHLFPDRAGLHRAVGHRIQFSVRVKDAAKLVGGEQRGGELRLRQRRESMIAIRVRLDRMEVAGASIVPSCRPVDSQGFVRLINGRATIVCEYSSQGKGAAFVTPLITELSYGYRRTAGTSVEILPSR